MSNAKHSKQTLAQGVHGFVAYEYANEAARLAATGFDADDTYKIAIQLSDFRHYILVDHDPITWKDVGNAAVNDDLNKVQINCRKNSAGTLPVGTVIYGVGYNHTSDYALVEKAKADSETTMPAIGIVNVEATDTVTGSFLVVGVIHMDTSTWSAGDCMYVSASVAGGLTNTAPSGPSSTQRVAAVLNSDDTDGHLLTFVGSCRHIDFTNTPEPLGTADAGNRAEASSSNHVHSHGNQAGGSLHSLATSSAAGFLPTLSDETSEYLRGDGSWQVPPSGIGYSLSFGGAANVTGRYYAAHGYYSINMGTSLDESCQIVVPVGGTIKCLTWITDGGSSSTVLKILVNGVVQDSVTLTGSQGYDNTLDISVSIGDRVAVEYDSGTSPGYSIIEVYIG